MGKGSVDVLNGGEWWEETLCVSQHATVQEDSTNDDWLTCFVLYPVPCVAAVMAGFMASRQQQPLCRAGERQPLEAVPHCQAGRAGADLLAAAARDTGERSTAVTSKP